MLHVVVGILCNDQAQVLIAKRMAHQAAGGLWEFPGGKVEFQELPFAALVREFKEEVGVNVIHATPFLAHQCQSSNTSILLDTWLIERFEGNPVGLEGQTVRWIHLQDLPQYNFPPGNVAILKKIMQQSHFPSFNKNHDP